MNSSKNDDTGSRQAELFVLLQNYLRHIPLILSVIALISIPTFLYSVNIVAKWPIEQTALSQFGWYQSTHLAFGMILGSSGILLLIYQVYLIKRYRLLHDQWAGSLFVGVYSLSFIGMTLAGIFPMKTPAVFQFPPDPLTIHFVSSSILILGFPASMLIFGIIVRKKNRHQGLLSFITSSAIYLYFIPFYLIPTARSSLLLELWTILWGLVWLNMTARGYLDTENSRQTRKILAAN